MLTGQPSGAAVQLAVIRYFAGERAEIWTAIAVFLVVSVSTAWLLAVSRTGFATSLFATILLVGGAMAVDLAMLLIRDHAALPLLISALGGGHHATALADEATRVSVVLSKFRYYRLGAAVLGAVSIAGLLLSGRGWMHGIAAGLLLIVVAQMVIDHFSEQRARAYQAALLKS